MANENEAFFEVWKKQMETGIRMIDALVTASADVRATQLSSARQAHESICALQDRLADAKTVQDLWGAQWNWTLASCERSAVYWRGLLDAVNEGNGKVARCIQESAESAVSASERAGDHAKAA